ncbi:hypothetical protein SBA4_870015 [Candidatus Sulfopaludibacter sp. SbA4]|nr:hypothetical protein SBA4_870015 [Candidatus Sulfopaludibacter sp. SbA4]
MPDGFLVLFLPLEFEDDYLVAPTVAEDGGLHGAAGHQLASILEGDLGGQLDFGADIAGQFFHAENVARSHPVLFSAGFNDRVHANLVWEPEHTECVGTTGVNYQCTTVGMAGSNAWKQRKPAVPKLTLGLARQSGLGLLERDAGGLGGLRRQRQVGNGFLQRSPVSRQ